MLIQRCKKIALKHSHYQMWLLYTFKTPTWVWHKPAQKWKTDYNYIVCRGLLPEFHEIWSSDWWAVKESNAERGSCSNEGSLLTMALLPWGGKLQFLLISLLLLPAFPPTSALSCLKCEPTHWQSWEKIDLFGTCILSHGRIIFWSSVELKTDVLII